jgi:transcriptional regulator with XRE-family HTH domain
MINKGYELLSPLEMSLQLAKRLRELRLEHNWKQETLAERSGVSLGSLRRFEHSGEVSLKNLLNLCAALGRLGDFNTILQAETARTMRELEGMHESRTRKRGSK